MKGFNRDDALLRDPRDRNAGDDWRIASAGFRLDADLTERDTLTIQGDGYAGSVGETVAIPSLGPLLPHRAVRSIPERAQPHWPLAARTFSETSRLQLQAYYDRTRRDDLTQLPRSEERSAEMTVEVGLRVKQSLDTFDLDFQHRFQWPFPGLERSDLVWGLGYRFQRYDSEAGAFALKPSGTDLQLASAFLSNDTTIVEKVLHFIVGSKFEHTTFTGFE